jgi:hypothetical protein
MDLTDVTTLERVARSRYEKARLGWSLAGAAPVLLVVGAAVVLSKRPSSAALFGGLLFVKVVAVLWRGRDLRRAVWPGVSSGLIPLVFALVANAQHGCSGTHCSTLCLPACMAGGIAAGLVVSAFATRLNLGWGFWVAASMMTVLTGSMGCSCVSSSGVFALIAGLSAGLLPQVVRRTFAQR